MLALAPGMLAVTFEHLRRCGAGRRECVVLWAGAVAAPAQVDHVIHPRHTATAVQCDFDPAWIGECWRELADSARTIRAQVHTHPGAAYHSALDDHFALVHTPGYLSLVIPRFAAGPVGLDGAYLAVRSPHGGWRELDPDNAIKETP
jgi:hypothetical protein